MAITTIAICGCAGHGRDLETSANCAGKREKEGERWEGVHCVCVFITEMSNYLTKDLGFAAGSVVSFNKLLTRLHVKVSRAWRGLVRKHREEEGEENG